MAGPSPQQLAAIRQHVEAEAAKRGIPPGELARRQREQLEKEAANAKMSPEQYTMMLRARVMAQAQRQQQQQQQPSPQPMGQPVPVSANTSDPKAIAVANFLRSQELKPRTCILNGQRKDMFKGKSPFSSI